MTAIVDSDPTGRALADAHERYAHRRPRTLALHQEATGLLPGGNTRTVLHHPPYPLRVVRAEGSLLEDADGHTYVDMLGNYSAGLFGHGHPALAEAVARAMRDGVGPGAHTPHEVAMAAAVCERFPVIERVRFTNSGTEANLMALSAARVFTGRERVLVFHGGYHGGLLSLDHGVSPVNAPYDLVLGTYNDVQQATELIRAHGAEVAAVLVEPMLGAGGCLPGTPEFLTALQTLTREAGALLVLDEVMTSRTGSCGLGDRLGVEPDLMTLGKYLGGGLSFGAFGGRADVMDLFDPGRPDPLAHAGTFNNNAASMLAGRVGLVELYPPELAERHTARGDGLRARLNTLFAERDADFQATGVGSLLTLHPTRRPLASAVDLAGVDRRRTELLFLDLLEHGYYVAARGYLALSLAVSPEQEDGFVAAVEDFVSAHDRDERGCVEQGGGAPRSVDADGAVLG